MSGGEQRAKLGAAGKVLGGALGFLKRHPIPVFLLSGTFSVVLGKLAFSTVAVGRHGVRHRFDKPWFADWSMFVGMTLCLGMYQLEVAWKRHTGQKVPKTTPKLYWAIAVPALCDLVATFMMNVGLLFLPGSIWQMLRGSVILFTALLKVFYRRKRLAGSEWAGVMVVMMALVVVGASTFKTPGEVEAPKLPGESSEGDGNNHKGPLFFGLGIVMVMSAQFLAALQTIVEEKLLHDVEASPTLVVGMEGVWGLLFCSVVSMPIAHLLPGKEGLGIHEDTIDSFVMLSNSTLLVFLNVGYVVAILLFNIYGMFITEVTDAMMRNLMEPVRTLFVWGAMVFTCYVISHRTMGETVNLWSLLELGGFAILCVGFLVFNGVIRLPCFSRPTKDADTKLPSSESPEPLETSPLVVNSTGTSEPSFN